MSIEIGPGILIEGQITIGGGYFTLIVAEDLVTQIVSEPGSGSDTLIEEF